MNRFALPISTGALLSIVAAVAAVACGGRSSASDGDRRADASVDVLVAVDRDADPRAAGDGAVKAPGGEDGAAQDGEAGAPSGRVRALRACMDERWGTSATRAVDAVLDDFDACATAEERADATGGPFFAACQGWLTTDPGDHDQFRRVAAVVTDP